jgi:hypothetical protein
MFFDLLKCWEIFILLEHYVIVLLYYIVYCVLYVYYIVLLYYINVKSVSLCFLVG